MKIDEKFLRNVIQPRPLHSHKGNFGRVLLVGGISPYGGAIIMAALATVKSGAGLVTVATQKGNALALHSHLPEAMVIDICDHELLSEELSKADTILIGCGLGLTELAQSTFNLVMSKVSRNHVLIIDGSALTLLARCPDVLQKEQRLILTPHQKEWEVLSGLAIGDQTVQANQTKLAELPFSTILVAKKHHTEIYCGSDMVQLTVGGPYQATGGMGDTLAGMIAGFVAQFKEDTFKSTLAAVYLHSAIADDLAKEQYVVLPTDISQQVPFWMAKYSK